MKTSGLIDVAVDGLHQEMALCLIGHSLIYSTYLHSCISIKFYLTASVVLLS